MNTFYEPKFLPLTGIPNKFACDRDLIFAAAADGRIKLWTYAEHWLDAIKKAGIEERVDYVELVPQDAIRFRTSSIRPLSRVVIGGRIITAETAVEVPDGELYVDTSEADKAFPRRPDPAPPQTDAPQPETDGEPLGEREEENLWRTLGALVLYVSKEKSVFTYADKPNANRIAEHVFAFLKDKAPLTGLSINSLEKRFAIALEKLTGKRSAS